MGRKETERIKPLITHAPPVKDCPGLQLDKAASKGKCRLAAAVVRRRDGKDTPIHRKVVGVPKQVRCGREGHKHLSRR